MLNKNKVFALSLIAASVSLAGCGGGGSDSSSASVDHPPASSTPSTGSGSGTPAPTPTPTPTVFSVSANDQPDYIEEETSQNVSFSFSGANGDVIAEIEDQTETALTVSLVDISSQGAIISIGVPELENNFSGNVVVTFTDSDDQTVSNVINIPVVNTSGVTALHDYQTAAMGAGTFHNLLQERELHGRLSYIAALLGVSQDSIPEFPATFDAELKADLINISNKRAEVTASYEANEITETQVLEKTADVLDLARNFSAPANASISSLIALTQGVVAEIPLGEVFLDKESGATLSQFIGNSEMGSYSTDWEWHYRNEFEFMAQLTQSSAACQVQ